VLVGNKSDKSYEREVSFEEGAALARDIGCEFFETSAKTAQNIDLAFVTLVRALRQVRNPQSHTHYDRYGTHNPRHRWHRLLPARVASGSELRGFSNPMLLHLEKFIKSLQTRYAVHQRRHNIVEQHHRYVVVSREILLLTGNYILLNPLSHSQTPGSSPPIYQVSELCSQYNFDLI
jgi:hypothetical protein